MPNSILLGKHENIFTGDLLRKMTKVIFDEDKIIELSDIWFYVINSDDTIYFSVGGLKKLIDTSSMYINLLDTQDKKTKVDSIVHAYYRTFIKNKGYLNSEENSKKWETDLKKYPDLLILIFCFDELLKKELKFYGIGNVESKRLYRSENCKDYWKSTENSHVYININAEDKLISFSNNKRNDNYSINFRIGIITHTSDYIYPMYVSNEEEEKNYKSIKYFEDGINYTIKILVSRSVY